MVINLSEEHSLVSNWVSEIRNEILQNDRLRFRTNLERIAEVAAYEISKFLPFDEKEIQTPFGIASCKVLNSYPILATILRAGLGMHQGLLRYYDKSDCAFISAYRKHNKNGSFDIRLEYVSCPEIENKVVIISDPMLATGASLVKTIQFLKEEGKPSNIHVVVALASTVGIESVLNEDQDINIWCGDVDDELTAKGYIVPGLGDAGDLAFGKKYRIRAIFTGFFKLEI